MRLKISIPVALFAATIAVSTPMIAQTVCVYQRDVTYIDGPGWSYVVVDYTLLYCDGGGGGGGNTGGGSTGGGPLPWVSINSVSDENPHQVTLSLNTTYADTMTLYRNGAVLSSGPPASFGLFGSLDDMISSSNTLVAEACNSNGCADATAYVYRNSYTRDSEGAITAWYNVLVPDPIGGVTIQHKSCSYTRILRGSFTSADYSVATTGLRNGQIQHVQSIDGLFWSDATTPPPWWVTVYGMTPYWSRQQTFTEGGPDNCNFPQNRFPYADVKCTWPAEFAFDANTSGEGLIQQLSGVSSVPETLPPFGALDLSVYP